MVAARRRDATSFRPQDGPVGGWRDLAAFLARLSEEERAGFSRYAGLEVPDDPEAITAALEAYAAVNPHATPSELLATTGARAATSRDLGFARRAGRTALELARTPAERQLAHVCLAQTGFQNRREREDLAAFEEHCRAAIALGHPGTFCYERLATLYEYRGDLERAASICRRAIEVLEDSADSRSAERFRRRLERLSESRKND